jgi:hypothetical protein
MLVLYRYQGNTEGYLRAINHVLMSLVSATEDYLERHPDQEFELRPVLYEFIEHLDQHIRRLSAQDTFVEGGLGI